MRTAAGRIFATANREPRTLPAMKQPFPSTIRIIDACQAVLARFLIPGGLNEAECIKELLTILDGPEAVLLTEEIRLSQEANPELAKLKKAFAKHKEAAAFFKEVFAEPQLATGSAMTPNTSGMAVSIEDGGESKRLREELARVRKHELHLIQDRDRLVAEVCGAAEQINALRGQNAELARRIIKVRGALG